MLFNISAVYGPLLDCRFYVFISYFDKQSSERFLDGRMGDTIIFKWVKIKMHIHITKFQKIILSITS